jgi:hypothetical protein
MGFFKNGVSLQKVILGRRMIDHWIWEYHILDTPILWPPIQPQEDFNKTLP